jgi:hypothetical protein
VVVRAYGVGLKLFGCWDSGFESHSEHRCFGHLCSRVRRAEHSSRWVHRMCVILCDLKWDGLDSILLFAPQKKVIAALPVNLSRSIGLSLWCGNILYGHWKVIFKLMFYSVVSKVFMYTCWNNVECKVFLDRCWNNGVCKVFMDRCWNNRVCKVFMNWCWNSGVC